MGKIFYVSSFTVSGFESSNAFIKTDGSIDENDYITALDVEGLQNISATTIQTKFTKNSKFVLNGTETFRITNALNFSCLTVDLTKFEIGAPICMNNQNIDYVGLINGANISLINTRTQNQTAFINNSTFNGLLSTTAGVYPSLLWATVEPVWNITEFPASEHLSAPIRR